MTLIDGSTFANSSIAMMAVVNDAFVPPYSSGISMAMSYMEMSAPSGMKQWGCTPCSKRPLMTLGSTFSASS